MIWVQCDPHRVIADFLSLFYKCFRYISFSMIYFSYSLELHMSNEIDYFIPVKHNTVFDAALYGLTLRISGANVLCGPVFDT